MSAAERNATDLRKLMQDVHGVFLTVDEAVAKCGPVIDLSIQEIHLLEWLGDDGPRMMRELAEFLRLAVNSVTTVVDRLEQRGLVRRQRSEEDRRIVRVELTDVGRSTYDELSENKLAFLRAMLEALSPEEQEIFLVLFRKIARVGRRRLEQALHGPS
jgi:DNA-binding MarR family transcriptional regulator